MVKVGTLFNIKPKLTPVYLFLFNDLLILATKKGWEAGDGVRTFCFHFYFHSSIVCMRIRKLDVNDVREDPAVCNLAELDFKTYFRSVLNSGSWISDVWQMDWKSENRSWLLDPWFSPQTMRLLNLLQNMILWKSSVSTFLTSSSAKVTRWRCVLTSYLSVVMLQLGALRGDWPRPPLSGAGSCYGRAGHRYESGVLLLPHAVGEPSGTHNGEAL